MLMDDARPASPRGESAPLALWGIALLALAPFPVSAALYCYGSPELAGPGLTVLVTWTAMVVAFLGGVRWGLESARPTPRLPRLAISASSSFLACAVLLLQGEIYDAWMLGLFILMFLTQWLIDHQTPETPARYPKLSTALTAGACISLGLALEKTISA